MQEINSLHNNQSKKSDLIVVLGSEVVFLDQDGEERTVKIVEPYETDLNFGKISKFSPVGKAFIGRKVGDEVEVAAPFGSWNAKILKVSP